MFPRKSIIGVVDPHRRDLHLNYGRLAASLRARARGYDIIAANEVNLLPIDELAGVLFHKPNEPEKKSVDLLREKGIPVVSLNTSIDDIATVKIDFSQGAVQAIEHLKASGKTCIAYALGPQGSNSSADRFLCFQQALGQCELPFNSDHVVETGYGSEIARRRIYSLLEEHPEIDAIVCCSDRAAIGAINAAKQIGLNVPHDLAVIGCGNLPQVLTLSNHPLSTITFPVYIGGYHAINLLFDIIDCTAAPYECRKVDTCFIARQSTTGDAYHDPLLNSKFTEGIQTLNFILSVGGSLTEDFKKELIAEFQEDDSLGVDLFNSFIRLMLRAISSGLDSYLGHHLIIQVGNQLGKWSSAPSKTINHHNIFAAIHSVSRDEIAQFDRYAKATEDQLDHTLEPFICPQHDALSIQSFAQTLSILKRSLGCRFMGLFLLDDPIDANESPLEESGMYWNIQDNEASDPISINLSRTSPTKLLRHSLNTPVFVDAIPLRSNGRLIAMIFIDLDTRYGAFHRKIQPSLEAKLQRALLFESLDKQQKELARQKGIAETANRAKSEFLAVMSHEIRTPLNCIMGMTDLALTGQLSDDQRSFLQLSQNASKDLLLLINDILDFSKIESEEIGMRNEPFSLRECLHYVIEVTRKRAEDKGLSFEYEIDGMLPDNFLGDTLRIQQILTNLINNATKFTPTGKIKLEAKPLLTKQNSALIQFAVTDTGIGIEEDKLGIIFDAFRQVDASTTRVYEGVGLGLAIVKRITAKMNGQVRAESEINKGSRFEVELPLLRAANTRNGRTAQTNSLQDEPLDAPQCQILLVDDNESNVFVTRSSLKHAGYEVDVAHSGSEAITAWQKKPYPLILMDVQMPGMTGIETTEKIRRIEQNEDAGQPTKIIALTAHAHSNNEAACIEAGMDDFIAKPINRTLLLQKIEKIYANRN